MGSTGREFARGELDAFSAGTLVDAHDVLGAHADPDADVTSFRVWAPNAVAVSVIGDFNRWTPNVDDELAPDATGIWSGRAPAAVGERYKYRITPANGPAFDKADPFGFSHEVPPATASVVTDLSYRWSDADWERRRGERFGDGVPVSIYEVHLGSWRAHANGFRDLAPPLIDHVRRCGFTHVEFLPITEHPFYGSWGYQTTGYFAPTARSGAPTDLMALIDALHQAGIGVVLDWVPSHFPGDEFALATFDGTHLYEHPDPRRGHHPDWDSCIFDYDRGEVRSFLLSSAHFWASRYHVDAIRVDAVASMLYLDYSRKDGEWLPNERGGNENLGAITLLRELNTSLNERHPGVRTIAEESTAWPGVTHPVADGGLGFSFKWDMGWMHDTLTYLQRDPATRGAHGNDLTFRSVYFDSEKFVLPLSHDEVVGEKGSLLGSMPGDRGSQFRHLRLLLGYQWATPGKKLLFMGGEIATPDAWNHDEPLPWDLTEEPDHRGVIELVSELNRLYRTEPALHVGDTGDHGFRWIVGDDTANRVFAFLRLADGRDDGRPILVVANFSEHAIDRYRVGVPRSGTWEYVFASDEARFGGPEPPRPSAASTADASHGSPHSIELAIGALSISYLAPTF